MTRAWWLGAALIVALAGCAGREAGPTDAAAPPPAAPEPARAPIPPASPLAKIHKGMRMSEVVQILGEPTDRNQYVTGKAFIPFYYGDDVSRIEWHYKSVGRVYFTGGGAFGQGGGEVEWVEYDPDETGYRR